MTETLLMSKLVIYARRYQCLTTEIKTMIILEKRLRFLTTEIAGSEEYFTYLTGCKINDANDNE